MNQVFSLSETFVALGARGTALPLEVGPSFWSKIGKHRMLQNGRLLGAVHDSGSGRSGWEMHPRGDELIVLLSGAIDLVCEHGPAESRLELRGAGATCIVPRGVWHCQEFLESSAFAFITPGAGTQHR